VIDGIEPNEEFIKSMILHELNTLREMGLVEIVGIDNDGEWLYAVTDRGRDTVDAINSGNPNALDILGDSLDSLFPDDDE
jgi:hypothetical protein